MKSKKIFFFAIFIILKTSLYAQPVHFIKFIHGGDEIKPTGTIVISVGGLVKPSDKPMDSIYGRTVQTDTTTFKVIINLIKNKKYKTPSDKFSSSDFFIIKTSDGVGLDLDSSKYKEFFSDLREALKNKDKAVSDIFKTYW